LRLWIEYLPKHRFLVALLLGSAGFLANLLHIPLLFNIDLLFGGIFVMLALQLCGLGGGILAAITAGSASWLVWNHPYSLLIFSVELIFTGLLFLRWRGNLMLANTLYWIFAGMPLAYFLHLQILHLGHDHSLAIMLKQALNGITNVIAARMIMIWLQRFPRFHDFLSLPISFQERISTLLASFVMAVSLLLLAVESRTDMVRMEQQIVALLAGAHRQVENMAGIVSAHGSEDDILEQLALLTKANAVFERVSFTLYDKNRVLIAESRKPTISLPSSSGTTVAITNLVSRWQPAITANLPAAAAWKKTVYFTTFKMRNGSLIMQTTAAAWMSIFLNSAVKTMSLILTVFLFTLLPGFMISRRINQVLLALGNCSSQLPRRIEAGQQPDWPRSSIPEIQTLIKDLRQMALALGQALTEKQAGLKRLQAESVRRENLEELLIEQRQQDRLRISRELHDDIGQSLQAIKLNLQVHLQECMKNNCPARNLLQGLVTDVEKTATDLRTVVISLRQAKDGKLCLCDALQSLTDRFGQNLPEPIQLLCSGPVELLSDQISTALFFVAQEAIANTVKHAAASTIEVMLTVTDQTVTLVVRDDGCGGATAHADGAGIPIMQERARLVGGTLTIRTLPESGTTILLEVPLP